MALASNTGRKKSSKNRHLGTIAQLCRAISSQLRHVSTIGKKLLSTNISSICSHNMVNFGPLAVELDPVFGAPLQISTGFASWQRYCTAVQYLASAKLCGVDQRAPPIVGRAAITLGIGPHSSFRTCSTNSYYFVHSQWITALHDITVDSVIYARFHLHSFTLCSALMVDKNSSGDEITNFYAVRP